MKEAAVKMAAVKMEAVRSAIVCRTRAVKVEAGADWCRPNLGFMSDVTIMHISRSKHIYKGICRGTSGLHWWQPVTNAMAGFMSDSHPRVGFALGSGVPCQDKLT